MTDFQELIGNYFLDANDPDNALKIHAYNADNYSDIMESMWSQAEKLLKRYLSNHQSLFRPVVIRMSLTEFVQAGRR